MSSIEEIKEAGTKLYDAVKEFVKKKGAMITFVSSLFAGSGYWLNNKINNVSDAVHNIEKLPETFKTLDSTVKVVEHMHKVYVKDSIMFFSYKKQMVNFLDTLPNLIQQAKTAEGALMIVKSEIQKLDSTQKVIASDVEFLADRTAKHSKF